MFGFVKKQENQKNKEEIIYLGIEERKFLIFLIAGLTLGKKILNFDYFIYFIMTRF